MRNYGPRTYASDLIKTKGHWAIDTEWKVNGTKGEYTIKMLAKGFTCDCPAYKKCKHITQIEANFVGEL
jgi:hypothetical protein|tara:strand:+ start:658 stop:864 length:207 start_codon:yes stop_codon:yes gene_type:complete